MILDTVRQAQAQTGEVVEGILARLTLPKVTYYRWLEREQEDRLEDNVVISRVGCRRLRLRKGKPYVTALCHIRCWATSG